MLRAIHVGAVILTGLGFAARGVGMMRGSAWIRSRPARALAHGVDTVLLVSAIALAWRLGLSPLSAPWLAAKLVALAAYIVLGSIALRPGRPRPIRIGAWLGALALFGYIVSVAITQSPGGFLPQ